MPLGVYFLLFKFEKASAQTFQAKTGLLPKWLFHNALICNPLGSHAIHKIDIFLTLERLEARLINLSSEPLDPWH